MSNFKSTLIAYDEWLPDGLFKNLNLPDGISKSTLTNVIMLECGELCPVWTNPVFMQDMIGVWSNKWQETFKRWVRAIEFDYDPLYNYDRYETITEQNSGTTSNHSSGTDKTISDRSIDTTTSGTDTDKLTGTDTTVTDHDVNTTTSGTTTNSRSAFDQTGFSDHDKSVTSGSDITADDSTVTLTHNTTDTLTRSGSESVDDDLTVNRTLSNTENGTDDHKRDLTAHMYGNIGVTTSQQMLQSEYDIALWNVYEHIKDLFMQEFCIMVY